MVRRCFLSLDRQLMAMMTLLPSHPVSILTIFLHSSLTYNPQDEDLDDLNSFMM